MATRKENEYFISDLIPTDLLDQAVAYIRDNVEPEDVYAEQTLFDWAGAGDPEQVFTEKKLREWAFANGFVESER